MGCRKVSAWALAVALAAGTAQRAHGQAPEEGSQGGLITRFFKRPAARTAKEDPVANSATSLLPAARRAQAQSDWQRRQEVCQRLQEIAWETADDDLQRVAEQLEQRAWDARVQQMGRAADVVTLPRTTSHADKGKDTAKSSQGEDR
jgi:hypothetical protein